MRRRDFVALFGGAAMWPLTSFAQQGPLPVIGFLSSRSPGKSAPVAAAFRKGLSETGYVVGQNVQIDYRWAEGQYDRLPALAVELVDLRVGVILAAGGPPSALAAKATTSTIPIVFSAASDPVALGLVASLNRPGGNLTGMSTLTTPLVAKGIELLKELLPAATGMAYLANPYQSEPRRRDQRGICRRQESRDCPSCAERQHRSRDRGSFESLTGLHAQALVVAGEPFFDSRRVKIVDLAAKYAVPASYAWRENVVAGGLMSYGTNLATPIGRPAF